MECRYAEGMSDMTRYRVSVSKESLGFSSGHFITYGGGLCETLHGHNYRIGVTLAGDLDEHALLYDFVLLRRDANEVVADLDHKMLLPQDNPLLTVERQEGEVEVRYSGKRYVFPESDVVFLPIANTTAELLAEYLAGRLADRVASAGATQVTEVEVEVEETFGQSGWCTRRLAG